MLRLANYTLAAADSLAQNSTEDAFRVSPVQIVSGSLLPCCSELFHSVFSPHDTQCSFCFVIQVQPPGSGLDTLFLLAHLSSNSSCQSFHLDPQLRSVSNSVLSIFYLNQPDGFSCQCNLFSFSAFFFLIFHCLSFLFPSPNTGSLLFCVLFSYLFSVRNYCPRCPESVKHCLDSSRQGTLHPDYSPLPPPKAIYALNHCTINVQTLC